MFSLIVPRKGTPTRTNPSITTSASKVASANKNRKSITFQNTGSATVSLGGSDVTGSNGYQLAAGGVFTDNATDTEWWAVTASGSSTLHVIEV